MFLKKIKALLKTTSFRLALGLSMLFSISSLVFFASVHLFFYRSLRDTDRTLITSKLKQYSMVLQEQGPQGLQKLFSNDKASNNEARFSVKVENSNGEPLFLKLSDDLNEFDVTKLEPQFHALTSTKGWSYIDALNDEDQLEVLTEPLENGSIIQVAKSTSERQDLLERATEVFAIATGLSLLIGGLGGYWFSKRTLSPLRDLLHTTQAISKENLNQRVKDTGSNDEFSELVKVYNSMLDRVQDLVCGMQESLDSIAHDIKTPMTRLKAMADLTLAKKSPTTEECLLALEECSEDSEEILSLLNSLLDIYEADAGAMNLKREEFNLHELLQEVLDLYEIIAEEKNISVRILSPDHFFISGDRARFKQVLANLVDNAIKYSPEGSLVTITADQNRDSWVVSVHDQGNGISKEDLPYIWNRLYRGDHSRSHPGSGLGLSLVQAIMKAHGGKAWVDTAWGRGSVFRVQIPRPRPA